VLRGGLSWLGPRAPSLAVRIAEHVFRTPPAYRASPEEREALVFADPLEVRFGETVLRGGSFGEGPAVLLVHGWGGRSTQLREMVGPLVDAGYRAVLFDGPGHGLTGGSQSSLPEMAAAIHAVIGAVGPVHAIIAHSMGAPSVALALERGPLPERLVFISPPCHMTGSTRRFAHAFGMSDELRERLERRLERRFLRTLDEMDLRHTTLPVPLLVVHDRHDREVPFEEGLRVARSWPAAELVETTGLGHVRILRDPGVVSRVVEFATEGAA
jgi:pimeloyl-ACP methyl ester carboxylesterase